MKEICQPSGGPWGRIKVEAAFISTLETIFGKKFFNKFKVESPNAWLQLMTNVAKAKEAFVPDGKCSANVGLPYCFRDDLKEFTKRDVKDYMNDIGDSNISFNRNG